MKQIDKLAWIELNNKTILLTKSYGKDVFYIPGGKRDAGETDEQALLREIREELTVSLDEKTLQYIGTFEAQAHGQPEGVTVKMTCYSGKYHQVRKSKKSRGSPAPTKTKSQKLTN